MLIMVFIPMVSPKTMSIGNTMHIIVSILFSNIFPHTVIFQGLGMSAIAQFRIVDIR